jgi:L-asparagine transporter-like permease
MHVNLLSADTDQARILREVARQGLLPYPSFFSSIKPFGTPLGPVTLRTFFTFVVILAIPAKDAFNFIIDLTSYPHLVSLHQFWNSQSFTAS